jgi:proline iminopeptidase
MSQFTRRTALSFGTAAAVSPRAFAAASGQPVTEGRAKVPGGTVWWMKVGSGTKTPLLTLHGGPGAGHNYLLPLKALADERPVVFYDQLGCGKADSPQDEKIYTIQRSVDELDAVRKALNLQKIVLFGHSWGSMLAIEYLCQGRGHGVEKLILGGALASVPQTNAGQMRLIAQLPNGDGAKIHALEKAHQEASAEYQRITDEFYALHVLRVKPAPPDAAASLDIVGKSIAYRVMNGPNEFTIVGVIKDWDRRKDLGRIKVPTLIVTGTYDEVTLDCHQTIQKGIKGSKLVILPGCSHLAMNEQPALYVQTLRKFMA